MPTRGAHQAFRRRDLLASAWPWRAAAYLLSSLTVGVSVFALLATLVVVGLGLAVVGVGLVLLAAIPLVGLPLAALERRRLRLVDAEPITDPHRVPERAGLRAWLSCRYQEPASWREFGYAVLLGTVLWPLDLVGAVCVLGVPVSLLAAPVMQALADDGEVRLLKLVLVSSDGAAWAAVPVGAILLAAAAYLLTGYGAARSALARMLLAPRETELSRRVQDLTRSRVRLVDAFDAERRRIERDLHDGAQQRLVALGLTLGLARLAQPAEATELVGRAHEQAGLALDELRELIWNIHPRILTDRGLPAAIAELADRSPIPVDTDLDLPVRPPTAIETTAYFAVCEALTNIARHSDATQARVTSRLSADRLIVEIADNGRGGADATRGSGLTGLADRVAVVAGKLTLTSPPGGPTLLCVELPCTETDPSASSSPRTVS